MNAVPMRVYLENFISVSSPMARVITDQGLNNFNTMINFSESEMKALCVTIHHPEGLVLNPRATNTGQPEDLREPDT